MSTKPYTNYTIPGEDFFYRVFDVDTMIEEELVWHRDRADRDVYVVEANGWQFQFDNEVPFEMREGDTIHIKKMDYHRILKGHDRLVLKILEK